MFIKLDKSDIHGWGVFASQPLSKGDVIETCPIYKVSNKCEDLDDYIFMNRFYVLGYGMVYNHSSTPNIKFRLFEKEGYIEFYTLVDIEEGKELLHDYGKSYFQKRGIIIK